MAKNIEMNYHNGSGYEVVYPKTLASLVLYGDLTVEEVLNSVTSTSGYVTMDDLISLGLIPLEKMTWIEISDGIANGNTNWFNVGDTKSFYLNGTAGSMTFSNTLAYATIIGINHNSSIEGSNKLHLQISLDTTNTALLGTAQINTSGTNSGGWSSSYMRGTICSTFFNCLPSDLKSVVKSVTKYTDNTGGGSDTASYVKSTSDKIFLLSEYEVFGARSSANSAEKNYQSQYDWYKDGTKIKYSSGSAYSWWLRSPETQESSDYGFCCVATSGSISYVDATRSLGFAPCLCV